MLLRERGRAAFADTSLPQLERADSGPGLLVRPDGYIAWAGDTLRSASHGFQPALERWLGEASPAAVR